MKKQLRVLLTIIFILGLAPINFSEAITQNQINAEVQIVCPDNYGNWQSGSGTFISEKGIILTNKHVVTDKNGEIIKNCFVGLSNGLNTNANFSDKLIAQTKYYSINSDLDVAILYVYTSTVINNYVNIANSDSSILNNNNQIEAIGYPGYNDMKLTKTAGNYVRPGNSYHEKLKNYFEATTYINHGNSGGGAFVDNNLVGLPTLGISTTEGEKYFFLSISSIKAWLSSLLGQDYLSSLLAYTPTAKPNISLPDDHKPPYLKQFSLYLINVDENGKQIHAASVGKEVPISIYEFPRVKFSWYQNCTAEYCVTDDESQVKGYYYYFGNNPMANPTQEGKYISSTQLLPADYTNEVVLPEIFTAQENESNYFILQAQDTNNNISDKLFIFEYIYEQDSFKDITDIDIKDYNNNLIGNLDYPTNTEIPVCLTTNYCSGNVEFGYVINTIHTNQNVLYLYPNYTYNNNGLTYYISYGEDRWWANGDREGLSTKNSYIKIDNIASKKMVNVFIKPNLYSLNSFLGKHHVLTINYSPTLNSKISPSDKTLISGKWDSSPSWVKLKFTEIDSKLTDRLKGTILLQVEARGEAYYVYPKDSKRYYMANGNEAYRIMRYLGVGITNTDLNKVKTNKSFAKQHSGKIFLQVEAHGEAFYIDFDGNAHYLKDGNAAYAIMRNLGLGITNSDLSKIPEGNL